MAVEQSPALILGVSTTADVDEVRAAYKRKVLESHPDKGGSSEEFRRVHTAYEALRVPMRAPMKSGTVRRAAPDDGDITPPAPKRQRRGAASTDTSAQPRQSKTQRQPRKPRQPAAKAAPPRSLSPRAMARSMGIFPQRSAFECGFPI